MTGLRMRWDTAMIISGGCTKKPSMSSKDATQCLIDLWYNDSVKRVGRDTRLFVHCEPPFKAGETETASLKGAGEEEMR